MATTELADLVKDQQACIEVFTKCSAATHSFWNIFSPKFRKSGGAVQSYAAFCQAESMFVACERKFRSRTSASVSDLATHLENLVNLAQACVSTANGIKKCHVAQNIYTPDYKMAMSTHNKEVETPFTALCNRLVELRDRASGLKNSRTVNPWDPLLRALSELEGMNDLPPPPRDLLPRLKALLDPFRAPRVAARSPATPTESKSIGS